MLALVVVVATCGSSRGREWIAFSDASGATQAMARVSISDAVETRLEIDIPGISAEPAASGARGAVVIDVPGATRLNAPGAPELPVLTYLVAIPDRGNVELEVSVGATRTFTGYDVAPAAPFAHVGESPLVPTPDPDIYGHDALFPSAFASVGEPMILRDLRLVQVRVYPVRYNPVSRKLVAAEHVTVDLRYTTGDGPNPKRVVRPYRSEAFEPIYRSMVINYGELPSSEVRRGSYLVICADDYVAQMSDFVRWKQERGIETILVPLSDIGANPSAQDIKDYIQNAYDTWDTPPDYVLLVGDTFTGVSVSIPCWYVQGSGGPLNATDHPYAELEGTDYFPDVMLGRMSVDSATEAIVAALKVLSYERDCDAGNDDWYVKALMSAGNYGGTHITSPRQTTLRVREMLFRAGYAQVDTVFYKPVTSPEPIKASINAGVSFVNYRGWGNAEGWEYPQFLVSDINALSNGSMLPVMTSIVCGTGNYDSWGYDPCFGEAWIRAGSPGALKGGPVMTGPTDFNTHTKWNNVLDVGIYEGILFEDLRHFGQALLRGKMEIYKNFPLDTAPGDTFGVEFYFNIYNTIGDPELYLRTARPDSFIVVHDSTVPLGQNVLTIRVTDSSGDAVPGAEVVVWKEDESYEVRALTGGKTIEVPLNAETPGDASVTVYAKNFKPYTGTVTATQEARYVGWYAHTIDDDDLGLSHGNGDGVVNPGETIELNVSLKNYGTSAASGVQATMDVRRPTAYVSVLDGQAYYGDIGAGAVEAGADDFVFQVAEGCPDGTELTFDLAATGEARETWTSELRVVVGAPVLSFYSVTVDDGGDGVLDPGETAAVTVALSNGGPADATSVSGTLLTPPSGLTASDASGYWGTIGSGSVATNSGDAFVLSADPGVAVGHEFTLVVDLEGDDGLSQFVVFTLVVGTPAASDPLGPDAYGYYCYDDTDVGYAEAPTYSWIEIDPAYGGSGTDLGLGHEDITDVALPFTFRYYGQEFDQVAVCSNGDVGLGGAPSWEHQPRNTIIPCPLGPDAMIAPFWDYLFPADPETTGGTGNVLTKDLGDGRFVVEWSRVGTGYYNGGNTQTFELVLFDQTQYPTVTGDGEILFQYHTIANADTHNYATVGIENPTQSDGLLYTYYGIYADEVPPLANGRAVKFTTDPPDAYPSTGVSEGSIGVGLLLLENRPNPFNPATIMTYVVPEAGRAELAIYDVSGRRVATLVDGMVGPGTHRVRWDGTGESGRALASGVYFARLSALGEVRTRKLVLLK